MIEFDARIKAALLAGINKDFPSASEGILKTLGYWSERSPELSGSVDDFIAAFHAHNENTQTEKAFLESAQSVHILFQLTDDEIAGARQTPSQPADFDAGNLHSFLFIAVNLNSETYSRRQYADFTREINKRLIPPAVVLFGTTANRLTIAFIDRRIHKLDPNRNVLGRVSLVREIDMAAPHRAHLDILCKDLSLDDRLSWMDDHRQPRNFDGLLKAWLEALDTERLNNRFYKDLFAWFTRAVSQATFPTNQAKTLSNEEHIIRLITRILFVWFIKEKKFVAEELFIEAQVKKLLKAYDRDTGDSYYRAILQNLFFATLNTGINQRGFSQQSNTTHRDSSRYRYKKEITDPERLRKLFTQTPFINGGLFDCLDSEAATGEGGHRIDCFSDNLIDPKRKEYRILSIPNHLFFGTTG